MVFSHSPNLEVVDILVPNLKKISLDASGWVSGSKLRPKIRKDCKIHETFCDAADRQKQTSDEEAH